MNISKQATDNMQLIRPIYISFLLSIILGFGIYILGTSYFFPLLAFSIFLFNVMVSFERKNSKILALFLLIIIYILLVATNNNSGTNGDYHAYHDLYNHFLNGGNLSNIVGYSTDFGYMVLMLIVSKLGISYNLFLSIAGILSLFLIKSTVSKITKNYNFVLVGYTLVSLSYDAFQFRYLFALSFVIYAFQFIIFEKQKSYLKYFFLILIASLFHQSMLFFLIYILIKTKMKFIIRFITVTSIVTAIMSYAANVNFVDIIFSVVGYSELEYYTSGTVGYSLNRLTPIVIAAMIFYFIFVITLINKKTNSHLSRTILLMNYLNLIILPFLLVSLDFERFMRPLFIINFALISKEIYFLSRKKRIILISSLLLVSFARQYLMFGVTETILTNNYVLDFLMSLTT